MDDPLSSFSSSLLEKLKESLCERYLVNVLRSERKNFTKFSVVKAVKVDRKRLVSQLGG